MEVLKTACPLDCPDSCTLDVTVDQGRVIGVDGNTINPLTEGFICSKVRRFPEHVYCRERILRPAIRDGARGDGRFRDVTWDEALARVESGLKEAIERNGAESILPLYYGGSNGYLTQDNVDMRLFQRLGASNLERTVCAVPSGRANTGLYGKMPGVPFADYVHSRLIVLWGVNPVVSGIHLMPLIKRARDLGAKLVVVDPRRNLVARQSDLHLAPYPGTDLPLALSVIRWLEDNGAVDEKFLAEHTTGSAELLERARAWTLERAASVTRCPAAEIAKFASWFAETNPAVVRCGWGLERNRNGGSAVCAVVALPAIAGKFGVRGGGHTMSNSGVWRIDPLAAASAGGPGEKARTINMSLVGRLLLEEKNPPIDALFVYNCNPLAILPRQELVRRGLEREDLFTVVFDQVRTDTARYADVLLPATTFLEHRELRRGYGSMALLDGPPVIDPVGEARPNVQVFSELCRRMGVWREGDAETEEELAARMLDQTGRSDEIRDLLDSGKPAAPEMGFTPQPFVDVFPGTSDRKVHLFPKELDEEAPHGLYHFQEDPKTERYPLALISPASNRTVSSTFGQLHRNEVSVQMSPEDAEFRRLASGMVVRVFNEFGEVISTLDVSPEMTPGVVHLPKGIWSHNTRNGRTSNALSPDSLTDLGQGACYNDARVEVERHGSAGEASS